MHNIYLSQCHFECIQVHLLCTCTPIITDWSFPCTCTVHFLWLVSVWWVLLASWLFSWLSLSTSWSYLFFSIFAAFQSPISLLLFSLLSLFLSYCFLPLCFSFLFLVEPTSHSVIVRTHAPVFLFYYLHHFWWKQVTAVETFIPYYHSYCCEGYYKPYCCVESGALWPCLCTDVCMMQRKCTTYGKLGYIDIRGAYKTSLIRGDR